MVHSPTFIIKINHSCRKIYQSHGSYGQWYQQQYLCPIFKVTKKPYFPWPPSSSAGLNVVKMGLQKTFPPRVSNAVRGRGGSFPVCGENKKWGRKVQQHKNKQHLIIKRLLMDVNGTYDIFLLFFFEMVQFKDRHVVRSCEVHAAYLYLILIKVYIYIETNN